MIEFLNYGGLTETNEDIHSHTMRTHLGFMRQ